MGRPRDEAATPTLLAVTRALVLERGYEAVTVADIAAAAGTGRQTLYRRWQGKADLVLDAFTAHARAEVDAGEGAAGASVRDFLHRTFRALDATGPALRGLMAHAQRDPAFRRRLLTRFVEPRRAVLRGVLARAREEGELAAGTDLDTAVAALYGALWYRLLLDEPLDAAYATALARLLGARPVG